ncbi:hypothetical protein [Embleya sp. NPDC059259]|uniref:hypothetical protein n=1 Tax=unclassified Embleya TaxID=2699296 RepID=UPI00369BB988
MNPLALLLDQAPASITGAVLRRIDPRLRAELFARPSRVGEAAGAYLVAHGDVDERAWLAGNPGATPETLSDLARAPEPAVAAGVFANPASPREARLRVLTRVVAATPLRELLYNELDHRQIRRRDALFERVCVLVESDDPRVVTRAFDRLAEHGARRPWLSGVLLRGCLSLLCTAGPAAVTAALPRVLPQATGTPSDTVAAALAAPTDAALVTRALDEFTGMPAVVARLRDEKNLPGAAAMLLAPRGPLDWDLVLREHRRLPWSEYVRMALAMQPGCPLELRAYLPASSSRHPVTEWVDADPATGRIVGSPVFRDDRSNASVRRAHTRGTLSAAVILRHGAPARNALRALDQRDTERYADTRTALRALTRPALGDRTEAWAVALALLPDFTGPLPHLLIAADGITAPRR